MGTITALTTQVKNPDRVSVFIDGTFVCGLASSVALGLRVGQSIEREELEQLAYRDEVYRGRERALRLLARRPYSSNEITQYLRRHKYDDDMIQLIVNDLVEAKLIDDESFAAYWVEQRDTFRPRSRMALRQELNQKGVERQIVDEVLSAIDETETARRVLEKQARRWHGLPETDWRTKSTNYLMRQGYPYDIVKEVVTEAWRALQHNDED
jgi:regulatory protein